VGASGGLFVCWNCNNFLGDVIDTSSYVVTLKFSSLLSLAQFHLTNGPCDATGKAGFINWLYNFDTSALDGWILLGDFNLIRSLSDKNKPWGCSKEMFLFSDLIQHLDLVDIPFEGRRFTWSNMQDDPLLGKLDWVFTSSSWTISYPATCVKPLSKHISDHVKYVVKMDSHIPRASISRFENYWADFPGFMDLNQEHWHSNSFYANMAKTINGKFKQLRRGLKNWSTNLSQLNKLINNCDWVLAMLDGLEDQRTMKVAEGVFRKLVKVHLQKLLDAKRIYWKQRSTVRWDTFGDENTKLFQAMATHSFRRNSIPSLTSTYGIIVTDHDLKAGLLWASFKDSLGISEFNEMVFDLHSLISAISLPVMDEPFSKQEIDAAVLEMPSDHAPGPDGFNGFFMKHCWTIIAQDFYMLCDCFCNGTVDLECNNGSFITLIPKKDNALIVNDYSPISLLNYSSKLITKILANRLQKVITSVIHANQYGFIKGRTIQYCLAWAVQSLHICHQSKKEILIVKLDFEKAFDKVEHQAILDMFTHKGFSDKWVHWIQLILSSGSSFVLLNGVPGKSFKCKRGVIRRVTLCRHFFLFGC
jgi:hypothetical protein